MDALGELLKAVPDAASLSQSEARAKRAKNDFFYFCEEYLGHAFTVPAAEYQQNVIQLFAEREMTAAAKRLFKEQINSKYHAYLSPKSGKLNGILDLEPRDHGKTTRATQAFPLWLILRGDPVFPVLFFASKEAAEDVMDSIKRELEENQHLIDDFGDQRTRKTWSKRKLVLANGSAIAARGKEQTTRGIKDGFLRPTHIICDDLLKDTEVESRAQRLKLYKWFKRVVMNLGKGALIIVVNTIMHPDDLPSRLLKEIESGQLNDWIGLRFSCYVQDDERRNRPIWPAKWSADDLTTKRRELGEYDFSTEWRNEAIAEGDRKFKKEWFTYFLLRDVRTFNLKIAMGVDPATGEEDGDFSSIVVVGKDMDTGLVYALDAWADRVSDLALADKLIEMYGTWNTWGKVKVIRFEEVAFQKIYRKSVQRAASRQGCSRIPIKGWKPGGMRKTKRIQALSPMVESGVLLFREEQEQLVQQLLDFPKGHDDLPDALEMAVDVLDTGPIVGGVAIGRQYGRSIAQRIAHVGRAMRGPLG